MPVFLFVLVPLSAEAQIRWDARLGVVDGEPMIGIELSGFGFTAADSFNSIAVGIRF